VSGRSLSLGSLTQVRVRGHQTASLSIPLSCTRYRIVPVIVELTVPILDSGYYLNAFWMLTDPVIPALSTSSSNGLLKDESRSIWPQSFFGTGRHFCHVVIGSSWTQ
jgi:hypothetical protein